MEWTELLTLLATLAISGWLSAFLVQLLKRAGWPSWTKLVLSLAMALVVGLATAWLSGDVMGFIGLWGNLTAEQVMTFATGVYVASATWYQFYFKDATWAQSLGAWPAK